MPRFEDHNGTLTSVYIKFFIYLFIYGSSPQPRAIDEQLWAKLNYRINWSYEHVKFLNACFLISIGVNLDNLLEHRHPLRTWLSVRGEFKVMQIYKERDYN